MCFTNTFILHYIILSTFWDIVHTIFLKVKLKMSQIKYLQIIWLFPSLFSPARSLSLILVLDLSQPSRLWRTMETLLQAAHTQLGKACSQTQAHAGAKHKASSFQPAARVLPKDYPVRTDPFIHYERCTRNSTFIV